MIQLARLNLIKKGEIVRLSFFSRANGFKGSGQRVLTGRCLFLKRRHQWVILYFCITVRYIRFIFKIPLFSPLITNFSKF